MCVHTVMQWTGIPSRMYSHLIHNIPRIGSGSTPSLTRIKQLLLRNEWMNVCMFCCSKQPSNLFHKEPYFHSNQAINCSKTMTNWLKLYQVNLQPHWHLLHKSELASKDKLRVITLELSQLQIGVLPINVMASKIWFIKHHQVRRQMEIA